MDVLQPPDEDDKGNDILPGFDKATLKEMSKTGWEDLAIDNESDETELEAPTDVYKGQ